MTLTRYKLNPKNVKTKSLTSSLTAIGVQVKPGEAPTVEHVNLARRIFIKAGGDVHVNNLWNIIKRFRCACGGIKLQPKAMSCGIVCGMNQRTKMRRTITITLLALTLTGCVSQKRKPIDEALRVEPPAPLTREAMSASRARSLVTIVAPPTTLTSGIAELGYTMPPDAAALGFKFYTGTTNGIFKLALTAGLFDNVTIRGLNPLTTNFVYATSTNASGVESSPSLVLAFVPRTNSTALKPSVASYTSRITWPNTGVAALETTSRLPGNWTRLAIVNTNGIAAVVVTNGVSAFFRANTSGAHPRLSIELWQQSISFSVPGVLQSLADANSGSWLSVATNSTGTLTVIKPVGNQWQVRRLF